MRSRFEPPGNYRHAADEGYEFASPHRPHTDLSPDATSVSGLRRCAVHGLCGDCRVGIADGYGYLLKHLDNKAVAGRWVKAQASIDKRRFLYVIT